MSIGNPPLDEPTQVDLEIQNLRDDSGSAGHQQNVMWDGHIISVNVQTSFDSEGQDVWEISNEGISLELIGIAQSLSIGPPDEARNWFQVGPDLGASPPPTVWSSGYLARIGTPVEGDGTSRVSHEMWFPRDVRPFLPRGTNIYAENDHFAHSGSAAVRGNLYFSRADRERTVTG